MSDLVRFGVAIERPLLETYDEHIARKGYENRSEALRDLMRAELGRASWERGDHVVATISLVYDHHVRDLTQRLNDIQHEHGERIVSATHVHLDHDHCLQVVIARGPSKQLKRLSDQLLGCKGVISGEVSAMAVVGKKK
jgi:CopG family nickel-responsive transcriptional regulator